MLTKAPARPTSFGIERHRAIVEGGERRLDFAEPLIDLLGDLISLRRGFLEAVHLAWRASHAGRGAVASPGAVTLHYEPLFEHLSMTVRPARS